MSRIAYFDCASGASGDMLLGALLDLGLPQDALVRELEKLPLRGYRLESHKVHRSGLHATKLDVIVDHEQHGHHHRGLGQILAMLDDSALDPVVVERAVALFRRLAEAEATVHGTSPEQVHFHEVGAVDSIVDVVGGVIGLYWLQAARMMASPLNLGTGTVTMSHGTFPVPPPATARLVTDVPVYGAGEGELLTPTGALLITGHATSYGPLPLLRPEAVGHGAGARDTPGRPNVLRIVVGQEEAAAAAAAQPVLVIECAIDDMSPQLFGPLLEQLLDAGALDAYHAPIQMKKGRPGTLLTLVVPAAGRDAVERVLFRETTTIGLRYSEWQRSVLEREQVTVETAYGRIGVKLARARGELRNAQPEFDDCLRAARAQGVPVKEVWAAALAAWRSRPA